MKQLLKMTVTVLPIAFLAMGGNAADLKVTGKSGNAGTVQIKRPSNAADAFTLVSPSDGPEVERIVTESVRAFIENLTLQAGLSGRVLSPQAEARLLSAINQNSDMAPAQSLAYEPKSGYTLAAPGLDLTFNNSFTTADGHQVFVVVGRDRANGQPVDMSGRAIAVMGPDGIMRAYDTQSFTAARTPMVVNLLIDVSGSMGGHMAQVIAAAKDLLGHIPGHVQCNVVTFGEHIRKLDGHMAPCDPAHFDFSRVIARGGTPLFTALRENLAEMNAPKFTDHQRVTLILTDGRPGDEEVMTSIPALKKDTVTVFFWLGNKGSDAEDLLRPYADTFVTDAKSAVDNLDQYFTALAENAKRQTVIIVRPLTQAAQ